MKESSEIGGFLELELVNKGTFYHDYAIAVNTGRNALEYIVKTDRYKKIFIPYYTCNAVLEPLDKLNLDYSFYEIDENFYPKFQFDKLKQNEALLYTNYFGLCSSNIEKLTLICKNLIVDNAQAFFDRPFANEPTFYSPRKFFGVADGGFLYNPNKEIAGLKIDSSYNRMKHLLGRLDKDAKTFYADYQREEESFKGNEIKIMSRLTKRILSSINYKKVKSKRRENYLLLHKAVKEHNKLNLPVLKNAVPLCYPFLIENGRLFKQKLIENKIYVPTYWPNVLDWATPNSFEHDLAKNLVCIPIDQRYGKLELESIIKICFK